MVKVTILSRQRQEAGRFARPACHVLLISALACGLVGCGTVTNKGRRMKNSLGRLMPWSGKKEVEPQKEVAEVSRPKKPAKDAVKIGRIVHVQRDQGFALIRSTYGSRLATGTEIKGHLENGEEVCSLRCSPERKSGFIVADIVSGEPRERQDVFVVRSAVKPTEAGSIAVPGPGSRTQTPRSIPGLPPMGPSTGVEQLPPLPDLPDEKVSVEELPDFPID